MHRARAIATPDNYRGGEKREGERERGGRRVKNVGVYISYRLLMELKLHRLLELRHMGLPLLMHVERFLPQ